MAIDERAFNTKVSKAVIENIKQVFGSETLNIINFYLKQFDTDLDHVSSNTEKVSQVLRTMFGPAACIMEKEIARAAYDSFGMAPDTTYTNLEGALKRLRESVKNL